MLSLDKSRNNINFGGVLKLAENYKAERLKGPFDTIIIGSGIGGMSLAAILSKAGKKVCVLERHYVPGGYTHTFQRKGYEWDVGVHYVGEVHRKNSVLSRIFNYITEGELKWEFMGELYDKAIFGDEEYDFVAGEENLKESFKIKFPQEIKAIDEYFLAVNQCVRSVGNFFMAKALPPLVSGLAGPFLKTKFHKFSDQTTYQVLRSMTDNEKLIGVLTAQYGDYGLPPKQSSFAIHAMVAKHYFGGGSYPIGGSIQFAKTIIPVIEKTGGQIFVKADVKRVLVKNNKAYGVELANGDTIEANEVVSNTGVHHSFSQLVPDYVNEKIKTEIFSVKPSLSHVCLYAGLKGSPEELGLPKYNHWIYPSYDHDKNLSDYMKDPAAPLPVAYVSFPSSKDPDWNQNFPGKSTIECIGVTPYGWFEKWENTQWLKRGADYDELKEKFAQKLLKQIVRFVPQVKDALDYYELSTPLSTKHFCNFSKGEIYGIEHTPERFRKKHLHPKTPVKHFYLTGSDIVTAGVGGALFGGVLTASSMLGKNVMKDIFKTI